MKKIIVMIVIFLLIITNLLQFGWYNYSSYFYDDVIYNENVALEIAETVLVATYGERVLKEKPFYINYDKRRGAWVISGRMNSDSLGGVATIVIRKKDGKILKITHGM